MPPKKFVVRLIAQCGSDPTRRYIFSRNKSAVMVLTGDELMEMTRECMIAVEEESAIQAKEARQKRSGNER